MDENERTNLKAQQRFNKKEEYRIKEFTKRSSARYHFP
jgi:hypothetical protein